MLTTLPVDLSCMLVALQNYNGARDGQCVSQNLKPRFKTKIQKQNL